MTAIDYSNTRPRDTYQIKSLEAEDFFSLKMQYFDSQPKANSQMVLYAAADMIDVQKLSSEEDRVVALKVSQVGDFLADINWISQFNGASIDLRYWNLRQNLGLNFTISDNRFADDSKSLVLEKKSQNLGLTRFDLFKADFNHDGALDYVVGLFDANGTFVSALMLESHF